MSYKLGGIIGDNSSLLRVSRLNLADSELAHGWVLTAIPVVCGLRILSHFKPI